MTSLSTGRQYPLRMVCEVCRLTRSSSAWARYADALRRISLARRSSKFSRSSSFSRRRSSVVSPGRSPSSRSACRSHLRNASVEQPNFSAIEQMAAHCESYWSRWSRTIRTARSRTSAEYLLRLPMAPSSHQMEPPENPGRFTYPLINDRVIICPREFLKIPKDSRGFLWIPCDSLADRVPTR